MEAKPVIAARKSRPRAVAAAPYRHRWDPLRFSLCALIVLSISRIHQIFGFLSLLRPGLLLTGLALLAVVMRPKALADPIWIKRWPARLLIGLSLSAVGSIAFGISAGGSWWFFSNYYWKVLVVSFLLMAGLRNERDLWIVIWANLVGSAILTFFSLFVFGMVAEGNGPARLSGVETWDANDVCVLLLITLPLCLLMLRTSSARGRAFSFLVMCGIGAVIARSGSRGGFVGLVAVLIAYLFSMKGVAKVRGVAMVVAVAVGLAIAAPSGYWKQMGTITAVKSDYNWDASQGRRQLAMRGLGYMMSFPLFGIGAGNFGRAEGTISSIAGQKGVRWSAPHNSYVEAGAEMGVPGLIMFFMMSLGCIVAPWRARGRIPASWQSGTWEQQFLFQMAIYLPLSAIGFAVPAYFVSFAYLDPIYVNVAMTGAFLLCVERRLRETGIGVSGPRLVRGSVPAPGPGPHAPPRARTARPMRWAPAPSSNGTTQSSIS